MLLRVAQLFRLPGLPVTVTGTVIVKDVFGVTVEDWEVVEVQVTVDVDTGQFHPGGAVGVPAVIPVGRLSVTVIGNVTPIPHVV